MNKSNSILRFFRSVMSGMVLFAACLAFQHASEILEIFSEEGAVFERQGDRFEWLANVTKLPVGEYYVSIGRPRSSCTLVYNERLIDSNESEIRGLRSRLMVGGAFVKGSNGEHDQLALRCFDQKGFAGDLTHKPLVMPLYTGQLLQLWRALTELILGPLSALLLVISYFITRKNDADPDADPKASHNAKEALAHEKAIGWRYIVFGATALAYALSLAYFTRLFMQGMEATVTHIVLRNCFSLAVMILFSEQSNSNRKIVAGQYILILSVIAIALLKSEFLVTFYRYQYMYFPVSTLLIAVSMFKQEPNSQYGHFLRQILLVWGLVQAFDAFSIWSGFGAYSAPSVIVMLSLSAYYLKTMRTSQIIRVESTVAKVLRAIEDGVNLTSILETLALIGRAQTGHYRASSYVDNFVLGMDDVPMRTFSRVAEIGYKKDTSSDVTINFAEGRGTYMLEAINARDSILRIGRDNAWFLIIPIGQHACINLSDDKPRSRYLAYEGYELAKRLLSALKTLDQRLIEQARQSNVALQKIRSRRGNGSWVEDIGVLFFDINDYTYYSDYFGQPFTQFVADTYFPALIRYVLNYASPEQTSGDGIYFVVIKELIRGDWSVTDATGLAAKAMLVFIEEESAALCRSHGFEPLMASIGVAAGSGAITADSLNVRTSGKLINDARRLQEGAGKNQCLIRYGDLPGFVDVQFRFGEDVIVHMKKSTIRSHRVLRIKLSVQDTRKETFLAV